MQRHAPRTPTARGWSLGRVVVDVLVGVLVAGFAVIAVAIGSGGWQLRPVLSGSMRPTLPIGGVVVTQRVPLSELRVGDVAVFHPPTNPRLDYVHRVISLTRSNGTDTIRTKGDANVSPDPWTLEVRGQWAYVARFSIPDVGYAATWIHSPRGRVDLLILAALLSLLLATTEVTHRRRRRAAVVARSGSEPVDEERPIDATSR